MYSDFVSNTDRHFRNINTLSSRPEYFPRSEIAAPDLGSIDRMAYPDAYFTKLLMPDMSPVKEEPSAKKSLYTKSPQDSLDSDSSDNDILPANLHYLEQAFDFDSDPEPDQELLDRISNMEDVYKRLPLKFMDVRIPRGEPTEYVNIKSFLDISKYADLFETFKTKRTYACKHCGEIFSSGCGLGGHTSKMHRAGPRKYKRKIFKPKVDQPEKERANHLRKIGKAKKSGDG